MEPSKNFIKYQRRLGVDHTEVVCTFALELSDLSFDEEELPTNIVNSFLKKNKYISFVRRSEKEKSESIKLHENSEPLIRSLFPEKAPQSIPEEQSKPVEVETTQIIDTTAVALEPSVPPKTVDEKITNYKSKLIESIPPFSLYTTFDDLLPSEILVTDLVKSNAVQDFEKVFSVNLAEYAQITDPRDKKIKLEALESKATDDFNKSWTQTIASVKEDKKYTFSIDIDNAEPKKIIFMIKGKDGTPLYLEQKSMGFRWFSAFHLRLRSLMKDGGVLAESSHKNGTQFVLLIDEPGQNLHDIAQKDVKKILEETAGKNPNYLFYPQSKPYWDGRKRVYENQIGI